MRMTWDFSNEHAVEETALLEVFEFRYFRPRIELIGPKQTPKLRQLASAKEISEVKGQWTKQLVIVVPARFWKFGEPVRANHQKRWKLSEKTWWRIWIWKYKHIPDDIVRIYRNTMAHLLMFLPRFNLCHNYQEWLTVAHLKRSVSLLWEGAGCPERATCDCEWSGASIPGARLQVKNRSRPSLPRSSPRLCNEVLQVAPVSKIDER